MEGGEPAAKKAKLQGNDATENSSVCDANDALKFHFLDPTAEPNAVEGQAVFQPAMCHQVFGDDEVCICILLTCKSVDAVMHVPSVTYIILLGAHAHFPEDSESCV